MKQLGAAEYNVNFLREAGLEAENTTVGAAYVPIIQARVPNTDKWYLVDTRMWETLDGDSIIESFEQFIASGKAMVSDIQSPFCQCLHEIENKLPRTKRCFMPCRNQRIILQQRKN